LQIGSLPLAPGRSLLILPAALVFSQFLPWLLTPLLMVGATYPEGAATQ
jgi:predicted DNA repair protein MutK